ncbi:MAG: uroporphyrinogen decarboxylase [Acidimicrobiales bacterium]
MNIVTERAAGSDAANPVGAPIPSSDVTTSSTDPAADRLSALLRAARQQPGDRVPVWFMRQAGRSLPEYFPVRGEGTILDAIQIPERATEITLQPVRRYGVDAAILFSDIVTPVWAVGFGIDITPGVGPECERPFRTVDDLSRLRPLDPDRDLGFQAETIRNLTAELEVPLIGFAGAPFTLAAYMVEGRPSKNHDKVKSLMAEQPVLWHELCDRLADIAIATLRAQVEAGAEAVQLFDSWAGALHPDHYRRFVAPHSEKIMAGLADLGVPRFHFGINTSELLDQFAEVGADVVGVDWRTPLATARRRTGGRVALQGNLDPALCLASWPVVEQEVRRILADNDGHPGHIFNLGHGVLPATDPDILAAVVQLVHAEGRADRPVDGSTDAQTEDRDVPTGR